MAQIIQIRGNHIEMVEKILEEVKSLLETLFGMEYSTGKKLNLSFNPTELVRQGEGLLADIDNINDGKPENDHTLSCRFAVRSRYEKMLKDAKTELEQLLEQWSQEEQTAIN